MAIQFGDIIINLVKSLAVSNPIVTGKAFKISDTWIKSDYFRAFVDPNCKFNFISQINNLGHNIVSLPYANFVNSKLNNLFNNIQWQTDTLYEKYRTNLFNCTDNLFYDNLPTQNIRNIININTWIIYFFKYINILNPINFSNYVRDQIIPNISSEGIRYIIQLINLLKSETNCLTDKISKKLCTYEPYTPCHIVNNICIKTDILKIAMGFDRNHIPTISEIFQLIFEIIDCDESDMCPGELAQIKSSVKLFYSGIFEYFISVYGSMGFESGMSEYADSHFGSGPGPDPMQSYVGHFLKNTSISDPNFRSNWVQPSLLKNVCQMEFYFVAEMINHTQLQKFYQEVFSVRSFGHTTTKLINLINASCHEKISIRNSCDLLYGSPNDKLHYGIMDLDRPKSSRTSNLKPVYWIDQTSRNNTYTCSTHKLSNQIDYVKIKHNVFSRYQTSESKDCVIDSYQLNLLRAIKLTEQYIGIYSSADTDTNIFINHWLSESIAYVSTHTIQSESCVQQLYLFHKQIKNNELNLILLSNYLDILREIFCLFNDGHPIQIGTQSLPHAYDQTKIIETGNILSDLLSHRNNYLSQYFYYAKYSDSINKIQCPNLKIGKFVNMHEVVDIVHQTISSADIPDDFEQNILNSMRGSKFQPNLSIKDIYDQINSSFNAIHLAYTYCVENDSYQYVFDKLCKYQSVMSDKIILSDKIYHYVQNKPIEKLSRTDIEHLALMAQTFGIDYGDFVNYLTGAKSDTLLYADLDYFLLKYQLDLPVDISASFKEQIIFDLFQNSETKLRSFFDLIPNSDYLFILEFFSTATHLQIQPEAIQNPIIQYGFSDFVSDQDIIRTDYGGFRTRTDVLEYFMDYVWDCSTDINSTNFSDFGYDHRPSIMINKICQRYAKHKTCATEYLAHKLAERSEIMNLMGEICHKSIVLLDIRKKEVIQLRNQVRNILYRNRRARTAWIKKLGHFIISEATIYSNDQIIDTNPSDWFEIFYEVSKQDGQIRGYNKMTGNIDELTRFDFKLKRPYTLVIPLIFYFNRNPVSSIPMTASLNTTYELIVKFRTLTELTYKEQFSEFIDPTLYDKVCAANIRSTEPHILNTYVMAEYIYLTTEERKTFVSNRLEYMMEELQCDLAPSLTDRTLKPVFKIGSTKKVSDSMNHGLKTQTEFFDPKTTKFTTEPTAESDPNIILRSDTVLVPVLDRTGSNRLQMLTRPLGICPKIHAKRFDHRYYFGNPSEFMAVIIKPDIHTDPSLRSDEKSYFHGEHQFDNYSLLSVYDLSRIMCAKKDYCNKLWTQLNSSNDKTYGFINLINHILIRYHDHTELFLESVQCIKEAYVRFVTNGHIIRDVIAIVQLKENLMASDADFLIWEKEYLTQLVTDTFRSINLNLDKKICVPTQLEIFATYNSICKNFDPDHFVLGRKLLMAGIDLMLPNTKCLSIISELYANYNEIKINYLIGLITQTINISLTKYSFANIIRHFRDIYKPNPHILKYLDQIDPTSNVLVRYASFKNIIWQITPGLNLIPFDMICKISAKLNEQTNLFINQREINLINYQKNMILNTKINPLIRGLIKFNNYNRLPPDADGLYWSAVQPYVHMLHTPADGINIFSWALEPFLSQPTGTANLTKIDNFSGMYDVHPLIGTSYPATLHTFVLSLNILRCMSGLNGKAWQYTTVGRG